MSERTTQSVAGTMGSGIVFRGLAAVLTLLLATLVWTVAWYWPTASQIASIWWSHETFAHGLVVFPISIWLIWNKRAQFHTLTPEPIPWMALPVALAGAGWVVGELVTVNALAHFSLMLALVLAFVGVLGWTIARVLAFPLVFLFFGVPIGEFLIPKLMDYTAIATVSALRLTGIPVYQEGLFFVIPSGRWSVVAACSGIRYLIASLMVGTLFAYLNYVSLGRRLLFVGVAIVVPIIANWMRAYIIVMIGHVSDNKLAAGVDHLLYGWVFFGIVIGLMFLIGSWWREDVPESRPESVHANATVSTSSLGTVTLHSLPILLVLAAPPLLLNKLDAPVEPYTVVLEAPQPQSGWSAEDAVDYDYTPRVSGYRGLTYRTYRHVDGGAVFLYVAYFADQRSGTDLVTSRNRLNFREEEGPVNWQLVSRRAFDMPPGRILRSVISDRNRTLAAWHWYWSSGEIVTNDPVAKINFAIDRLSGRPDDAAFVAVLAPVADRGEDARPLVEAFLRDHGAAIQAMLERAGKSR